ncbi:MAG: DNA recombination/repair protein RecA, partial [Anaerolineae bacterium]|nr:DNA recombination/repair protein RecA [Anaerolineae bacterium]
VEHDIVTKRGAFYSFGDTRLGQGRENSKIFLQENQDLFLVIENQILEAANLPQRAESIAAST